MDSPESLSFRENMSKMAINLSTAGLIWLFGVLVFLPIAETIDPVELPRLFSLVILASFTVFLIKGLEGVRNTLDVVIEVLTQEYSSIRGVEEGSIEAIRRRINKGAIIAVLVIIYLFYSPLLTILHRSINGIAIIITLFGIVWALVRRV